MPVTEILRRQSGHRVVVMRDAVVATHVLVRDVVAQHGPGDARRAVRVKVGLGACLSDFGRGDGGDGAAETVAYDGDAVGWVGGGCGAESGEDAGAGFEPAVVAVGGALVLRFGHERSVQRGM